MITSISDMVQELRVVGPGEVICDPALRNLCARPYVGHPRGCPNFAKKIGCPPKATYFLDVYEPQAYIAAVRFEFDAYLEMMASRHPRWSDRQLRNPLYWQGHLRKRLRGLVNFHTNIMDKSFHGLLVPEAMGVNVTETCRLVGLELEWPPERLVHIVALFAKPKENVVSGDILEGLL